MLPSSTASVLLCVEPASGTLKLAAPELPHSAETVPRSFISCLHSHQQVQVKVFSPGILVVEPRNQQEVRGHNHFQTWGQVLLAPLSSPCLGTVRGHGLFLIFICGTGVPSACPWEEHVHYGHLERWLWEADKAEMPGSGVEWRALLGVLL